MTDRDHRKVQVTISLQAAERAQEWTSHIDSDEFWNDEDRDALREIDKVVSDAYDALYPISESAE